MSSQKVSQKRPQTGKAGGTAGPASESVVALAVSPACIPQLLGDSCDLPSSQLEFH